MEVICPPCSGSGLRKQTRTDPVLGTNGTTLVPVGPCPLCHGAGEILTETEDRFWSCVRVALDKAAYRIPWQCGEEAAA